ncbi:MAG: pyridoxamine 5-phosphate oxidase-related FMN-binding protein [Streptosporangiaceae bacterium]|jgi:PPOX class probable F420-dependent enzyme|nr:pyridoxamine 5-phosphate oxidase-related FMN-binding protein [Streptosporangiaceae bacterium]
MTAKWIAPPAHLISMATAVTGAGNGAEMGRGITVPTLTQDEARTRLAAAPVVRLATADRQGRPHLVAITFAVDGDRLYSAVDHKPKRSRDLRRLRNIQANPEVAVLADHYEDDWERLWWVRVDGQARIISEAAEMAGPIRLLMERYAQYRANPPEGPVIEINIERWSGWAYTPAG